MVFTMLQDFNVMKAIAGPDINRADNITGMTNFLMITPLIEHVASTTCVASSAEKDAGSLWLRRTKFS
jgi:hypothetical protein